MSPCSHIQKILNRTSKKIVGALKKAMSKRQTYHVTSPVNYLPSKPQVREQPQHEVAEEELSTKQTCEGDDQSVTTMLTWVDEETADNLFNEAVERKMTTIN